MEEIYEVRKNYRKKIEIKDCPICGNERCRGWGKSGGKQVYKCMKCNYKFIRNSSGYVKIRKAHNLGIEKERNRILKLIKDWDISGDIYRDIIKFVGSPTP